MAVDWRMRHQVAIYPHSWDQAYEVITRMPGKWDVREERIVEPRPMKALILNVTALQRLALEACLPNAIVAVKTPRQGPRRRAGGHGR